MGTTNLPKKKSFCPGEIPFSLINRQKFTNMIDLIEINGYSSFKSNHDRFPDPCSNCMSKPSSKSLGSKPNIGHVILRTEQLQTKKKKNPQIESVHKLRLMKPDQPSGIDPTCRMALISRSSQRESLWQRIMILMRRQSKVYKL